MERKSSLASARCPVPLSCGVSGLPFAGYTEKSIVGLRAGTDAEGGAEKAGEDPNDRCLVSDHRWPAFGDASPYAAGASA